jgi:hypothetical protein
MNDHTVDLSTPFGPVTAEFSKGRLTGSDVAVVNTGPGFGINQCEYSGAIFLNSPGWIEPSTRGLYDSSFAAPDGKHPFPRDRAVMVAAIRTAVANYAAARSHDE